jgi:acetolactate synthase I/II/III large subunit
MLIISDSGERLVSDIDRHDAAAHSGRFEARVRTGGDALADQLIEEGVTDLFCIPGAQLDWAVDAIRRRSGQLRLIAPRHEQATSYMADGYARSTGKEGVCMVVPGPGMLNALSGIATAYACNAPVLFLVGQIPSRAIGKGFGLLHEIPDQSEILRRLTKWHGIAAAPGDIPALVHEAFVQLRSGRPRPVAVEIPPDILEAAAPIMLLPRAERQRSTPDPAAVQRAAALLAGAKFPVIHAGGGAAAVGAGAALRRLAERLQAPVVMSEGGRGLLDDRHPLALTTLGGRALHPHADVVLVIGSRFLDAQARPMLDAAGTRFIYANLEARDMGAPRRPGLEIQADALSVAEAILEALPRAARASAAGQVALVKDWAAVQLDAIEPQAAFVAALRQAMAEDDILVSELTQVGYYANIAFPVYGPRLYLTPGYQGTLGYGFNTALGAAFGNPDKRIVSINGDGGFGWGLQELATAARDQLDISIVVFVDGHFGNVRRMQKRTFGESCGVRLANPDYVMLAEAHGIPGIAVETPEDLGKALTSARTKGGPTLIAVAVGEMPSPWPLIHSFLTPASPPPANPLGAPHADNLQQGNPL